MLNDHGLVLRTRPSAHRYYVLAIRLATTPYFLSRYGLNLAKKAIFTQFLTKIPQISPCPFEMRIKLRLWESVLFAKPFQRKVQQ